MSAPSAAPDDEDLPRALYSETLDVLGFKLTAHVLEDGRRVFEIDDQLRGLLAELGVDAASLATDAEVEP